jgi:hypothetical protein
MTSSDSSHSHVAAPRCVTSRRTDCLRLRSILEKSRTNSDGEENEQRLITAEATLST